MKISLYKREYLRGIIDGQRIKLPKMYDMSLLDKIYKRYIKLNPRVKHETYSPKKRHENAQKNAI